MPTKEFDHMLLESVVREIGGEDAIKVAKLLDPKEETTDEAIASASEMKLNAVRKILYRLYDARLAEFRRIRDKTTGWFIYFWRLRPERVEELVTNRQKTVYKKLKNRLDYEKNFHFFKCDQEYCPRYTFDEAMENNFRCPECGGELQAFDNKKIIERLSKKVEQLHNSLVESGVNIKKLNKHSEEEEVTRLVPQTKDLSPKAVEAAPEGGGSNNSK
jgi:transcription initiation factor TFIIE subunit alpha